MKFPVQMSIIFSKNTTQSLFRIIIQSYTTSRWIMENNASYLCESIIWEVWDTNALPIINYSCRFLEKSRKIKKYLIWCGIDSRYAFSLKSKSMKSNKKTAKIAFKDKLWYIYCKINLLKYQHCAEYVAKHFLAQQYVA